MTAKLHLRDPSAAAALPPALPPAAAAAVSSGSPTSSATAQPTWASRYPFQTLTMVPVTTSNSITRPNASAASRFRSSGLAVMVMICRRESVSSYSVFRSVTLISWSLSFPPALLAGAAVRLPSPKKPVTTESIALPSLAATSDASALAEKCCCSQPAVEYSVSMGLSPHCEVAGERGRRRSTNGGQQLDRVRAPKWNGGGGEVTTASLTATYYHVAIDRGRDGSVRHQVVIRRRQLRAKADDVLCLLLPCVEAPLFDGQRRDVLS